MEQIASPRCLERRTCRVMGGAAFGEQVQGAQYRSTFGVVEDIDNAKLTDGSG